MEGHLFIVSRKRADLVEHLANDLFAHENLEVILERRRKERRQRSQATQEERRRGDRRTAWAPRSRGADPPDLLDNTRSLYTLSD